MKKLILPFVAILNAFFFSFNVEAMEQQPEEEVSLPRTLKAPRLSVTHLFRDLTVLNPENDETWGGYWTPVGLGPLAKWRSAIFLDCLTATMNSGNWFDIPVMHSKPILYDPELHRREPNGYFAEIPLEGKPEGLDETWITYKYAFFPQSIMPTAELSDLCDEAPADKLDEPMIFFFVGKFDWEWEPGQCRPVLTENEEKNVIDRHLEAFGLYSQAEILLESDPAQAIPLLVKAAELGSLSAKYVLGICYYYGSEKPTSSVERDVELGKKYLLASKDPIALTLLGDELIEPAKAFLQQGLKKEGRELIGKAMNFYERAGRKGYAFAYIRLGALAREQNYYLQASKAYHEAFLLGYDVLGTIGPEWFAYYKVDRIFTPN